MTPIDSEAPVAQDKAALRKMLRDRRARYVAGLPASTLGLVFRVLPSPIVHRLATGATIALYRAIGPEAPTDSIADQLDSLGYRLALPRMDEQGVMTFAAWDSDRILVPGPFRTLQPDARAVTLAPDVIIAPLVGFDAALNRLGQGGGHYDRAFAAHPAALRVGLAWSVQAVDRLPAEPHDLPLDIIVTEVAILERDEETAR
ncbi:5-formyltetrahydrofolate cyclo-ligase [soil metagenome]